ncbi:MAG: SGNH/GDSL hydrolase family protein [Synechococcus sp.]|nr:SGNH/GDSL hydrolase family protein [Synechococcus sp.]
MGASHSRLARFRSALKVVAINSTIIVVLILIAELVHRSLLAGFGKTCFFNCSYHEIIKDIGQDPRSTFREATFAYDSKTGYAPKPFLSGMIFDRPWDNSVVSTGAYGIRNSAYDFAASYPWGKVLTVGDSFTFGSEVPDGDTWQSCLNSSQTERLYINAGVGGYGTAQAFRRAELLIPAIQPKYLIVSTLVGKNFQRDRLSYRSGFPMPAVVRAGAVLQHASPPDPDVLGSRLSKQSSTTAAVIANTTLLRHIAPAAYQHFYDIHAKSISREHSEAATKPDIIDWVAERSASLKIPTIWLLQYAEDINSKEVAAERSEILRALQKRRLAYVDTHDALIKAQKTLPNAELWKPHHTKLGNEIVCKSILAADPFGGKASSRLEHHNAPVQP